MKKKRVSAVIGCLLALIMMVGIVMPLSAAAVTLEFLNPLGTVIPPANQPLVTRPADLNGKTVKLINYGAATTPSALSLAALGDQLKYDYPSVTIVTATISGTMYDAKTPAIYDGWAQGADAVVFGVVEDNVGAWWIAHHAKEIEARGVPVVVVANSWWESAVKCGAEDNGFAAMRMTSIDRTAYADAYGKTTTGTPSARVTYLNQIVVELGVYNAVKSALTAPLTDAEKSSLPLSAEVFGDLGVATLSVSGSSFEAAMQEFQDLSMASDFGDGLPLDIPTREAVNALLATTDRAPDEVLGRIMLRGGLITVEKVAINAVMAGARPEHFPVILAAMEAYATAMEDNKLFYQPTMANEQATLMLVVSGPMVDELDVGNGRAFDPGSEGEGVIGRAVRLCARNIGHVLQQNSTIINAFYRINDHEMYVVGESNKYLPEGWKTNSEMFGFPAGSNSVTLMCITRATLTAGSSGGTATATANITTLRTATNTAATAGAPAILAINFTQAEMMAREDAATGGLGISSKEELQATIANNPNRNNLIWPIVCGFGRSQSGRAWHGTATYNTRGFQTQFVAVKGDAVAPSAPQNVTTTFNADNTEATLAWTAPVRSDDSIVYQVSADGGVNWIDAGESLSYTITGLNPDRLYTFYVRAVNDIINSADIQQVDGVWELNYAASGRGSWAITTGVPSITSLRIDAASLVTLPRNSKKQLSLNLNLGASADGIIWSSSSTLYATVDQTGLVTVLNRMGTATITAKDPVSGISHSVILRIT